MRYLFILLFLFSKLIYSQNKNPYPIKDIEEIEYQLKEVLIDREYVVFSTDARFYLVIIKEGKTDSVYKEFFYIKKQEDTMFLKAVTCLENSMCLKNIFNKDLYHTGLITLESDFYKDKEVEFSGVTTYFVLKTKERKKYGEAVLTSIIKPLPFDTNIYLFLINRITNNISSNSYFDKVECERK